MKLKNPLLVASFALLMLCLSGCNTMRRAGKDLGVVVTSPVLVLYAASTDAASTSQEVRKGLDGGPAAEVISFVPAFFFHGIKHVFYVLVHAGDFFLTPVWGLAELHPYGPEITPLDYYQNTWFDRKPSDGQRKTDAQSGEVSGK